MYIKSKLGILVDHLSTLKKMYPEDADFYDLRTKQIHKKFINYCDDLRSHRIKIETLE